MEGILRNIICYVLLQHLRCCSAVCAGNGSVMSAGGIWICENGVPVQTGVVLYDYDFPDAAGTGGYGSAVYYVQ